MHLVAGLALATALAQAPPCPEAAVVIGIEDYAYWPDAPGAAADAHAFREWLVARRGLPAEQVQLVGAAATRGDIQLALRKARLACGGRLWIYFSGHGTWSSDGRVLVGSDAPEDPDRAAGYGVPLAEVRRMTTGRGGTGILIVEAGFGAEGRDGATLPVPRAGEPAPGASGLAEWVAASPAGPTVAVDGQGAFTAAVTDALTGHADADGDGRVAAEEASGFVRARLAGGPIVQVPKLTLGLPGDWPEVPTLEPPPAAPLIEAPPAPTAPPAAGGTPDWVDRGSGLYRVGDRRVLRGVGTARGHRYLMDAKKAAKPAASTELEALIQTLGSRLAIELGRSGASETSVAELREAGPQFVTFRQRLITPIDGEHLQWEGRPDDTFWAMAELPLADFRAYLDAHAELGPAARTWVLANLDRVFDETVTFGQGPAAPPSPGH